MLKFIPASLKIRIENKLVDAWYHSAPALKLLLPLAAIYRAVIWLRRLCYQTDIFKSMALPCPVIVVGNITLGGSGKTPLVIYLCQLLHRQGYKPGIISRGYGGRQRDAYFVKDQPDPLIAGDEALLLAKSGFPFALGQDRVAAAKLLLAEAPEVNVIISDDGLQHYRLQRQIEIAVFDSERKLGNGYCLPAGPLREPKSRLTHIAIRVFNGEKTDDISAMDFSMQLVAEGIYNVKDPQQHLTFASFKDKTVHAVAGIGNPSRFFKLLASQGLKVIPHPFPDHWPFTASDFNFPDQLPILMTEKDQVKCRSFAKNNFWALRVKAELNSEFDIAVLQLLRGVAHG